MKRLEPQRVLGVLAGNSFPLARLAGWAESAELVVAADGGANRLWRAGIVPDDVVGDMDSISPEVLAAQRSVHKDADQSKTDCEKLLGHFLGLGYESATLVGAEGDLLDHTLAALQCACKSQLRVRFVLRKGQAWALRGGQQTRVRTRPGARVSLLPLCDCGSASLAGVKWPLDRQAISPQGLTSVSNLATGTVVEARLDDGAAVLFVQTPPRPSWP